MREAHFAVPRTLPRRVAAAIGTTLLALTIPLAAGIQTNVGLEELDEALTLIRSGSANDHARFNAPYRVTVGKEPLDYLEVVTPFRRVVLAGAARWAVGDRSFGQRQAIDLVAAEGELVDLYAELTFHPLNTYIGVPAYELALETSSGARIRPVETIRLSRWTPRLDGPPAVPPFNSPALPRGTPLLGATVVGRFELAGVAPSGTYVVVMELAGKEEGRASVSLARMR